jgi:predicted TIM-barrel fold metal-dependent hydrolase
VVEPLDLWVQRLPAHLKERAPRIADVDDELRLLVEGMAPRRIGGSGTSAGEQRDRERQDDQHFRSAGWDPDQRIVDLDEDGVWGEMLYPTIALFGFMTPDPELRWASCRAYNDWLAETFAAQSSRFAGAAIVAVQEVDTALAEIERVAELGLCSVMLPMNAPDGQPYNSPVYDPVWAAAQAHGMPVSFHVGTGSNSVTESGPGGAVINYVEVGLGA